MKLYILLILLLFNLKNYSQELKCADLLNFIETNGNFKSTLNNSELNSSWLFKVSGYTYKNINYVIVGIKKNENSTLIKKYIYCEIPTINWNKFMNGGNGVSDDFGKRFWKYIIEYKCDCN